MGDQDETIHYPQSIGDESRAPPSASDTNLRLRGFGDYELLSEIARGGMGVVYKARQVSLNRLVALKMILAGELASLDEVRRFHTEAEAAALLDHPGIVPIFEIGQYEDQHFFSMAFVEGESLAKRVMKGPLPSREAAEIMIEVSQAVNYAHVKGVIHRDLKPGNILLDRNGRPRVTDFGVAKLTRCGSDVTGTGQILGTPSYMPPEQAAGKTDQIGPLADVYSLGALLYCLLIGRPPFQASNALDTLLQVIEQEPVALRKLNRDVPLDLEIITLKCLEKNPASRYRSAGDVAADLQRFLDDEPILARHLGVVGRLRRWSRQKPLASGCLISAGGLIGFSAGIACFVGAVISLGFFSIDTVGWAMKPPNLAFSLPPSGGQTPLIRLEPGTLNRVVLHMQIRSTSFEMDGSDPFTPDEGLNGASDDAGENSGKQANPTQGQSRGQFNFPVKYSIFDAAGETLDQASTVADWSGLQLSQILSVDKDFTTVITHMELCKLRSPTSGQVQVRVAVAPDEIFYAQAQRLELRIYERIPDGARFGLLGGALFLVSPFVLLAGLVLLLYGPFLIIMRTIKRK